MTYADSRGIVSKLGFSEEFRTAFLDLPLRGRGTIRRMVDEVKRMG